MSHIERRLNDNAVLLIHRITRMHSRIVPNIYVQWFIYVHLGFRESHIICVIPCLCAF